MQIAPNVPTNVLPVRQTQPIVSSVRVLIVSVTLPAVPASQVTMMMGVVQIVSYVLLNVSPVLEVQPIVSSVTVMRPTE